MRKLYLVALFALLATSLVVAHPPAPTVKVRTTGSQPRVLDVQEFPGTPGKRIIQTVPGTPGKRITTLEEDLPPPPDVEEHYVAPQSLPLPKPAAVYPRYAPTYTTPTYTAPTYVAPTYVMPAAVMPAAYIPLNFVPANATVDDYRTGVLGLKRNVHTADGKVIHYGPLGRPRRTTR